MRSLSSKLVLAFLITSLTGAVLASIFVRQFVNAQFTVFVVNQQRDFFINRVSDYYFTHSNSLNGINKWIVDRADQRPPDAPPDSDPRRGDVITISFCLAGSDGKVLIPNSDYEVGDSVPEAALRSGTQITVGSQVIGVVITPSDATIRSPIRDPAQEAYLTSTDAALAIAAAATAGIALLLGGLLARLITHPLRELTTATRKLAAGDLGHQVSVRSRDELGELATQFRSEE
ncbi:MAG: HAMP domain-containing protein, partial [Oscillochloris sp.]|nr:HAMP domain-containing protein [Oscillochloris sp.]